MKQASIPGRQQARRQYGVTLIEALVALMVMSFGMVALMELMGNLRRSGDLGKQRSEAMRLAQAEMAKLRSFSLIKKPEGSAERDYVKDIISIDAPPVTPADSNATYTVSRSVTTLDPDADEPRAKSIDVMVTWNDRSTRQNGDQQDAPQTVVLSSIISRTDPAFAGALSIAPPPGGGRQPAGRHPVIPAAAQDLGNKTSAYRPSSLGSVVWVFNNATGVVVGKCAIPAGTAVTALTPADVESCKNNTVGYLISGIVRFSYVTPPNPTLPEGLAIKLGLEFTGGAYQTPELDSRGRPRTDAQGNYVMKTVTATPPGNYECFNDSINSTSGTQPFVSYDCVVYLDTGKSTWSGKLALNGFNIGTTDVDYRVCRYSADYNGNKSIYVSNSVAAYDNQEHPAVYVDVTGSLTRQNFLVIKGRSSCPAAPAVNPTAGVFADYSTQQLQPAP
ncbi:prepilin-type N-terminal cleavage/methylation domain-containing protein [Roseateles sp. DC23W]|uniref:Prepilin-type N-terminal cleavage/methylation domain-containing protein n=1 Tax=Pelomonas dachongensis TaxID=3299029 RepID=A0ABW7EMX9_9BURK